MNTIIIDGNNLIGKFPELFKLQRKNGQAAREKIAFLIERHFIHKKIKVFLHFDGFQKESIRLNKVRLIYSDNIIADENIRSQITNSKNPKLLTIVTSDFALAQFARKCSCEVIKSETFAGKLTSINETSEEDLIKSIDNDEMLKLFQQGKDE